MKAKAAKKSSGIGDLPAKIGRPATGALLHAGIKTLRQVSRYSEREIADLHGVGPVAITRLRAALRARGLSFAKNKSG